jgi:hypothetical protein
VNLKPSLHVAVVFALPSNAAFAVTVRELADRLEVGAADVEESLLALRRAYLATMQGGKWNLTVRGVTFRNALGDLDLVGV